MRQIHGYKKGAGFKNILREQFRSGAVGTVDLSLEKHVKRD